MESFLFGVRRVWSVVRGSVGLVRYESDVSCFSCYKSEAVRPIVDDGWWMVD